MTMPNSPTAGWYADPNGGSALRYWDGSGWTDATQPAPVSAGYPGALPGQSPANPGHSGAAGHSGAPGYPGVTGYPGTTGTTPGYPSGTPGYPADAPFLGSSQPHRPTASFAARNRFFLVTAAICGVYALVATFSNFALFGVLPALYTFRSFQAKEPLAIVALIVTVATIFFSLHHIYR